MDSDDVTLNMKIGSFLVTLTRHQQKQFGDIMQTWKKVTIKRKRHESQNIVDSCDWKFTPIPDDFKRLRTVYIDGSSALGKHVPYPKSYKLDTNHSYLSIKSMITHFLAIGVDFHIPSSGINNIVQEGDVCSSIYKSKTVQEKVIDINKRYGYDIQYPLLILFGFEFSDDFDPNSSTKSNRQSIWMKSLSISPQLDDLHSMSNTFPVSFGQKGVDHEIVEEHMSTELNILSQKDGNNIFYDKRKDQMVRVHFELLVSLQDQPERRSSNGIMGGNGNYSSRWGYSCNFKAIQNELVTCGKCMKKLLKDTPIVKCKECTNWTICGPNSKLLESSPSSDYPEDSPNLTLNKKLIPFQITYKELIDAINLGHEKYFKRIYTKKKLEEYFKTFNLNSKCLEHVCCSVENTRENTNIENHPQNTLKWLGFAIWRRNVPIKHHVDVIMHLLFLGIVKSVIQKIING